MYVHSAVCAYICASYTCAICIWHGPARRGHKTLAHCAQNMDTSIRHHWSHPLSWRLTRQENRGMQVRSRDASLSLTRPFLRVKGVACETRGGGGAHLLPIVSLPSGRKATKKCPERASATFTIKSDILEPKRSHCSFVLHPEWEPRFARNYHCIIHLSA